MNNITTKRIRIQQNINRWQTELTALQELCEHPDVIIKHEGNTGNYDPSSDCYWTTYKCPDCDKYWTVYAL